MQKRTIEKLTNDFLAYVDMVQDMRLTSSQLFRTFTIALKLNRGTVNALYTYMGLKGIL